MAKRILLAESTFFLRQLVRRNLERFADLQVTDVADALEYETALQTGGWDLVVLDLGVHGRDGLELLGNLRSNHPDLPVVLLSANSARLGLTRQSGAAAAFAIPIDLELLGTEVGRILGV